MSVEQGIGDILKGVPEPVETTGDVAATPAEKVETDKPDKPRDEAGKFKAEERPEDKPVEAKPGKLDAGVEKIIEQRRALQRERAELEKLRTPTPKPSVFDNEDEAINSRVKEATTPLREAFYNLSVKAAKAAYKDDFDTAYKAFAEQCESDPGLITGLQGSADPGEYIMRMGTHIAEVAPYGGDILGYREGLKTKFSAQVTERDEQIKVKDARIAELEKTLADLSNLPRSLNSKSSAAAPKAGEADAEDIKSLTRFGKQTR